MKLLKTFMIGSFLVVGVSTIAQKKKEKFTKLEIEMFPKAKEGFKQVYVQLPIEKNEENLKVEFFIGIEKALDCNNYFIIGKVKTQDLQGWGYSYYDVESKGEVAGTLRGCLDQKITKKFISLQPEIVRYNSRLPLVFYVPKDMEVRYRVLRPDVMKKGIKR